MAERLKGLLRDNPEVLKAITTDPLYKAWKKKKKEQRDRLMVYADKAKEMVAERIKA